MKLLELANVETYYGPVMAIRGVSLGDEKLASWFEDRWKDKYTLTITKEITGLIEPRK